MKNENEKILYSTNIQKVNDVKINLEYSQKIIQQAVTEFEKIDVPITINQLESLFDMYRNVDSDKLEDLLRSELVKGKEGNISGLQLNTERLKELIVLPDVSNLMASLYEFRNQIEGSVFCPDVIYWQYFTIKKGKVSVLENAFESLTSGFNFYASTHNEIERLNSITKLRDAVYLFCASNPDIDKSNIINPSALAFMKDEFVINPAFIETGRI